MLRTGLISFLLVTLAAGSAGAQTRHDLEIQQAKLTDESKALDEISRSYGQYVVIRDQALNGVDGFYPQSKQWFTDASTWLTGWSPLVAALEGSRLADADEANRATQRLSQQLTALKSLLARQAQTLSNGQRAVQQLAAIQRIDPSRVAEFAASASSFNAQVDQVQSETAASVGLFGASLTVALQGVADQLDQLLSLKLQKLALDFPELETALREVERTMMGIKLVDVEVARIASLDAELQKTFGKGRVYAAIAQHEDLKRQANQAIATIRSQPQLTDGAKDNGVSRLQTILSRRQAELDKALALITRRQRFMAYYRTEVINDSTSMVRKCRATTRPTDIDCSLLRSVVFTEAQLRTMTDDQLAYLEKALDRVKAGPLSPTTAANGASQP